MARDAPIFESRRETDDAIEMSFEVVEGDEADTLRLSQLDRLVDITLSISPVFWMMDVRGMHTYSYLIEDSFAVCLDIRMGSRRGQPKCRQRKNGKRSVRCHAEVPQRSA